MRNRAKCKLCGDVIESHTTNDRVECDCGEIEVFGGHDKVGCAAKNWANFIRIDDEGNEKIPQVVYQDSKVTREEALSILNDMIEKIADLPPAAMNVAITHYDFLMLLYWLKRYVEVED